jgi:hypothetical protein
MAAISDNEDAADANNKRQCQEPLEELGFDGIHSETPGEASMLRLGRYSKCPSR